MTIKHDITGAWHSPDGDIITLHLQPHGGGEIKVAQAPFDLFVALVEAGKRWREEGVPVSERRLIADELRAMGLTDPSVDNSNSSHPTTLAEACVKVSSAWDSYLFAPPEDAQQAEQRLGNAIRAMYLLHRKNETTTNSEGKSDD